jgi:hypothetical protein
MPRFPSAPWAIEYAIERLETHGERVDPGTWQGVKTDPSTVTLELLNLQLEFPIPLSADELSEKIEPNQPWAEDHFMERVGRKPTNPGEEYKNWPWWRGQDEVTMSADSHDGKHFTHTYQERFWPKNAGSWEFRDDDGVLRDGAHPQHKGIRYDYGDLDDVVGLLKREPQTRQATFPIFFPEDTGAVHGGRIPCTLHYHFLLRNNRLHLWYAIRSCDAVRHFRDDLYMACRLCQWVLNELSDRAALDDDPDEWGRWGDVEPGMLHFTAYSFHVHMGDRHLL